MMEAKGDELLKALIAAKSKFPAIVKNKTGQARGGKYRYADLTAILDAIEPHLSANGMALVQAPMWDDNGFRLATTLYHVSGASISCSYPLPAQATSQEMGSALTYSRRYSICALLSLSADEDDDGAEAEAGAVKTHAAPPPPKPAKKAEKPPSNDGLAGGQVVNIAKADSPVPHNKIQLLNGQEFLLITGNTDIEKKASLESLKVAQIAMLKKSNVVIEFHLTDKGNQIVDAIKVEA